MKIGFAESDFAKLVNNDRLMIRRLGKLRATFLIRRLAQLSNSTTLEDVRHMSGRFHELKGDRKGQWSCDLDQPYRLIFEPFEKPIPLNESGQFVWAKIESIIIIGIEDYH